MIDLSSAQWIKSIESLHNAKVHHININGTESLIVVFSVGPFKMAYPDFLHGNMEMNAQYTEECIALAQNIGVDIVRFQGAPLTTLNYPISIVDQGTVCISDLNRWQKKLPQKAKRAQNKLKSTLLSVRKAIKEDTKKIYQIYIDTISRNKGNIRYTKEYFENLISDAAWVATFDHEICAFVCIGQKNNRGVYLHGGYIPSFKQHYPHDLLYITMLNSACDKGLISFDFLPSPIEQPSLTKYKLQWGGDEAPFVVTDVVLRPIRGRVLVFCMWTIKQLKKIASKVQKL